MSRARRHVSVGFTGTREGMTAEQRGTFRAILNSPSRPLIMSAFSHGACVGADSDAVEIVHECCKDAVIVAFPGHMPRMTCQRSLSLSRIIHKPHDTLDRNRDIVDSSMILVACPKGPEQDRSGTWFTVRYARTLADVRIVVIWPDGKFEVTQAGKLK